jgi:hypothetical protein
MAGHFDSAGADAGMLVELLSARKKLSRRGRHGGFAVRATSLP